MKPTNDKLNNIKEAIVKAIAFFDLFDYPLTSWEIWQYGLWGDNKVSYNKVLKILNDGILDNILANKNGFYFLAGRERIIRVRMERYNYSSKKFKKAILVARLFKIIPWIKMIAVSNIIGSHNTKKESDIDIFIITKSDRVWLTRLFSAGLMKILGQRPSLNKEKDKICLNFYISEEKLNLENYLLNDSDIYFIYWLTCLIPIYNKDNTYQNFIKANNWLKKVLTNWQKIETGSIRIVKNSKSQFYYDLIDLFFGGLEFNAINFQLKRMPKPLKKLMNQDSRVVINDQVLKLHIKDRRFEYKQKWEQKLVDIELKSWTLQ